TRWQPALFIQLNSTGSLVNEGSAAPYTDKDESSKLFILDAGHPFVIGDRIEDSNGGAIYTIIDIAAAPSDASHIYVDRVITDNTQTGTLAKAMRYRYY